jgi:hypothetical protein
MMRRKYPGGARRQEMRMRMKAGQIRPHRGNADYGYQGMSAGSASDNNYSESAPPGVIGAIVGVIIGGIICFFLAAFKGNDAGPFVMPIMILFGGGGFIFGKFLLPTLRTIEFSSPDDSNETDIVDDPSKGNVKPIVPKFTNKEEYFKRKAERFNNVQTKESQATGQIKTGE